MPAKQANASCARGPAAQQVELLRSENALLRSENRALRSRGYAPAYPSKDGSDSEAKSGEHTGGDSTPEPLVIQGKMFVAQPERLALKLEDALKKIATESVSRPPPGLPMPAKVEAKPLNFGVSLDALAGSADEAPPSKGSAAHPHRCGLACKFFWKSSGCKDGVDCDRCHLCRWSRSGRKVSDTGSDSTTAPSSVATGDSPKSATTSEDMPLCLPMGEDAPVPSVGSIGHATGNCREACRYVRRKGGCRAGHQCTMCHLCRWCQKAAPKSAVHEPHEAATSEGYAPGILLLSCMYASATHGPVWQP